jgi:hypothetical protein
MVLSYKARRRWALLILLIGMPAYVVAAVTHVGLGFLWALPFRFIFRGIGQEDPDTRKADGNDPSA